MTAVRAAPPDFASLLAHHGLALRRGALDTLQFNLGRRCNQACHHCHVEAGPKRTEMAAPAVVDAVLALLAAHPGLATLDLTGGAPELHPEFRRLVRTARALGRRVIDRCNLTVLLEPGQEDTADFLAAHAVEVVASLPCYEAGNVDRQRGRGVFDASILALQRLNALGYGAAPELPLTLVYNPQGARLPPPQAALEARYREELATRHGIRFTRLIAITNMPIRRFLDALLRDGEQERYLELLAQAFNAATVPGLMCRTLLSVGWDGRLHDCDFNQMLDLPLGAGARRVDELHDLARLEGAAINTAAHCLGCTAGAGSSCGGSLA